MNRFTLSGDDQKRVSGHMSFALVAEMTCASSPMGTVSRVCMFSRTCLEYGLRRWYCRSRKLGRASIARLKRTGSESLPRPTRPCRFQSALDGMVEHFLSRVWSGPLLSEAC